MTQEEYSKEFKAIQEEYERSLERLGRIAIQENAEFKKGDVIEDLRRIRVDRVGLCYRYSRNSGVMPRPMYIGVGVTKKGEPMKDGLEYSIYDDGVNLIKKIS